MILHASIAMRLSTETERIAAMRRRKNSFKDKKDHRIIDHRLAKEI